MKIKSFSISAIVILVSFILYYSQGLFYESGSIISQLLLVIILGISSYYYLKVLFLTTHRDYFLLAWSLLTLINIFGYIFTADFSNGIVFNMFKRVLICLLCFYPFYYLSLHDLIKKKHLILFILAFLPITILQYFKNQLRVETELNSENIVNNVSYAFIVIIPFLFLIKKRVISLILLVLIWFFVIQSAKRGALITAGLGTLIFTYFLLIDIRYTSIYKRLRSYSIALIGIVLTTYFVIQKLTQNEFFMQRLENMSQGESSNRTQNFKLIWDAWLNSDNLINLVFGFGFASSLQITGQYFAHNDWLELLSNFGILGVILYLFLFLILYKTICNKNFPFSDRMIILCVVVMWFFMTLVSMWYTSLLTFTQVMVLGYYLGQFEIYRKSKI